MSRRAVVILCIVVAAALLISACGLGLLWLAVPGAAPVSANSTLYLRVDAPFSEIEPDGLLSPFVREPATLRGTIDLLRKAKVDSRIAAVVVIPQTNGALWGQLQEVREAILDYRKSGKPAIAYMESGGAGEYYLASACNRILMMPAGELDLSGLAMYELFFRGALDKLGVVPDLLHVGDYKTASNTFTETGMTPAHREMDEALNHDAYDELVRAIAEGRKRAPAEVRDLLDKGPFLAAEAKQAGLVDELAYEDQIDDNPPVAHTARLTSDDYRDVPLTSLGLGAGPKIAVLYAVGTIASGKSSFDMPGGGVLGSDTFNEWLRTVRVDDSIKAIVVRIDSPGGSAIASDVIWREMMLTRDLKPLIVSMGDVAASGGYYIAVPAQVIVADPGTLTGSIGVVTGKFALGGALDKIGVTTGVTSDGRLAELDSPFRPFTKDERAKVEEQMHATYETFVARVAAGRHSTPEKIDAIGQGRVWSGARAQQIGLVDVIGGLEDALAIAKARAKLDPAKDVEIVAYPGKRSFADVLAGSFSGGSASDERLLGTPAARAAGRLAAEVSLFRAGEPLALMPNIFW